MSSTWGFKSLHPHHHFRACRICSCKLFTLHYNLTFKSYFAYASSSSAPRKRDNFTVGKIISFSILFCELLLTFFVLAVLRKEVVNEGWGRTDAFLFKPCHILMICSQLYQYIRKFCPFPKLNYYFVKSNKL